MKTPFEEEFQKKRKKIHLE